MGSHDAPEVMRVFRARHRRDTGEAFAERLLSESVELAVRQPGCLGYLAAGPLDDEFLFVTLWRDLASVQAFGGERWEQSVLPAGYAELLVHHGVEHLPLLRWQFDADVYESTA